MKNRIMPLLAALLFAAASFASAGNKTYRSSLDKLNPHGTLDLKCVSSSYKISFPVPERWTVRKAGLLLRYTNSSNLRGEVSQLSVRINDVPVGQVKLDPRKTEGEMSVNIPAARLENGYNTLTFSVVQHYQDNCEQWDAPDLWTNLQFDRSFLELEYAERRVPAKLPEALGFMFDPKALPAGEVNVVLDKGSRESVLQAGVAASGIARRFDYKKVGFTASAGIVPGRDNILVGEKKFVEPLLSGLGAGFEVAGPMVKVVPLPLGRDKEGLPRFDRRRGLLVIAGRSPEELKTAARAAAEISFPFPGAGETIVKEVSLPDLPYYSGRGHIETGRKLTFRKLGLPPFTFRGIGNMTEDFSVRVPNDYLMRAGKYISLSLNFIYGPGLKEDSSLTVIVNDTIAQVINMANPAGERMEKYKLDIPAYLFTSGENKIRFIASLTPKSQACELLMVDSYFLTVYNNSTFTFPKMPHLLELPRLELFADNAFPFGRLPGGGDVEILLPESGYDEIAAMFNLAGFISRKSGYPLYDMSLSVGAPEKRDRELLVIGRLDKLPEELADGMPVALRNAPGESEVPNLSAKKWGTGPLFSLTRQIGALDTEYGMLMGMESPYVAGRSVLFFGAHSSAGVADLSRAVLDHDILGALNGTVAAVSFGSEASRRVASLDYGRKYWTGKDGRLSRFVYFMYVHPFMYYGSLIFLILVLSLLLYFYLSGIRARRLELARRRSPVHGGKEK